MVYLEEAHIFVTRIFNPCFNSFISVNIERKLLGKNNYRSQNVNSYSQSRFYFQAKKLSDVRDSLLKNNHVSNTKLKSTILQIAEIYVETGLDASFAEDIEEFIQIIKKEYALDFKLTFKRRVKLIQNKKEINSKKSERMNEAISGVEEADFDYQSEYEDKYEEKPPKDNRMDEEYLYKYIPPKDQAQEISDVVESTRNKVSKSNTNERNSRFQYLLRKYRWNEKNLTIPDDPTEYDGDVCWVCLRSPVRWYEGFRRVCYDCIDKLEKHEIKKPKPHSDKTIGRSRKQNGRFSSTFKFEFSEVIGSVIQFLIVAVILSYIFSPFYLILIHPDMNMVIGNPKPLYLYDIDSSCDNYKGDIVSALNGLSDETGVSFVKIQYPLALISGGISYTCDATLTNYNAAGESESGFIGASYIVIAWNNIKLKYISQDIILHETLHSMSFGHSSNPNSIMYFQSSYQNVEPELVSFISKTYVKNPFAYLNIIPLNLLYIIFALLWFASSVFSSIPSRH